MNYKNIFSKWIADGLCRKGYHIVRIEKNRNQPDETVFTFEVTGDFYQDLDALYIERQSIKNP